MSKIWTGQLWKWSRTGLEICSNCCKHNHHCISRSEKSVRPWVKMVKSGGRYVLFSETTLQVQNIFHSFQFKLIDSYTARWLHSTPRRGAGPHQVFGHFRHQAADGGGVEGSSDSEEVSKPRHLKELSHWEMSPGLRVIKHWSMLDIEICIWTLEIWWICFRWSVAKALLCKCAQLCIFFCDCGFRQEEVD